MADCSGLGSTAYIETRRWTAVAAVLATAGELWRQSEQNN